MPIGTGHGGRDRVLGDRYVTERTGTTLPATLGVGRFVPGLVKGTALGSMLLLTAACHLGGNDQSANQAVRAAIEDAGVDPSSELVYEHYFYFDDEQGAHDAEKELVEAGFDTEILPPVDGDETWALNATRRAALSAVQLDALTEQLSTIAARHGGTYDGWDTPLG